jgi:putative beta-lysine N-acetyltransferase
MIREVTDGPSGVTLYEDEYSKRVRVDDYHGSREDVLRLINTSLPGWTEKLIIKSRTKDLDFFLANTFRKEAFVAGYFAGADMHFVTRYLSSKRRVSTKEEREDAIVQSVLATPLEQDTPVTVTIHIADPIDAPALAELYHSTFRIYPTPVSDPQYIRKTMREGTTYVFVREGKKIVSAASAEINQKYRNAELTDCATAEGHQGKGYMRALLLELEHRLRKQGITCPYTIARSESFGMNKVFHQLGYAFGGRMTKNCMIYSGLEDMNVWHKYSAP